MVRRLNIQDIMIHLCWALPTFVLILVLNIDSMNGRISSVGGSLLDVQLLADHSVLGTTQRYIEASDEAKRRVVELV